MATAAAMRRAGSSAEWAALLASAHAELERLSHSSESEIASVMNAFKNLAGGADQILKQAAAIVGSVGDERVNAVPSRVRSLSTSVQSFLQQRLEAATAVLETLQEEERLLRQLTWATQCQEAVAGHLKALSVLTNVEVAQLGEVGGGFQFLAQELYSFAKSVSEQTLELARHAEARKRAIEDTRRDLAASLPGLRAELHSTESDLEQTLLFIDNGLSQLGSIPERFRSCAEAMSQQIARVVAAIQSQDITRQQIEHVQQALQLVSSMVTNMGGSDERELPKIYGGLTIQTYQLKNIRGTLSTWISQVGSCMKEIQELSASEIVKIGSIVLEQERELSSQLLHIEQLQGKSEAYGAKIQETVRGLLGLVELVNDHIKRSQTIRHRLQMLTLNSLIEAHHLGRQGAVVSSIANLIKNVSAEWSVVTDQSRSALAEIANLVDHTNKTMESFSEVGTEKLRADQALSGEALHVIRNVAVFVGKEAAQMQAVTEQMRGNVTSFSSTGGLEACLEPLDAAMNQIEAICRSLPGGSVPGGNLRLLERCDEAEMERLFAASYTTEIEREVFHAALQGAPLPVREESFEGNTVELF